LISLASDTSTIFGFFQDMRLSFKDDRQFASKLTFDVQAQFVKLDFAEMPQIRRRRRISGP
jgi:hypothetical protein